MYLVCIHVTNKSRISRVFIIKRSYAKTVSKVMIPKTHYHVIRYIIHLYIHIYLPILDVFMQLKSN